MNLRLIHAVNACISILVLAGCSEVAPTNPFDPETPTVNRAKTAFTGVVMRFPCQGGEPVPAANVTVTPEQDGQDFPSLPTGEDGTYRVDGLVEGEYLLRFSLERHVTTARVAVGRAGEVIRLDTVSLSPIKASLEGTVALGAGIGGGTTVILRSDDGDQTIAGTERVAMTTPPTGDFRFDELCAGVYAIAAVADGYRTAPFEDVTVTTDEITKFEATLRPRKQTVTAPSVTNGPLPLIFQGDNDLTHVRTWFGSEQVPDDVRWIPLPEDGRVEVTLPSEGLHIIYAELATQAATDDDVSNDLFAHISERLSVTSLLDQTPPVLASVIHEPDTNAQPNYALYDSGEDTPSATLILSALDPVPSSTLDRIIFTSEDESVEPIEKPFNLRTSLPLPQQGPNTVYVRLKDSAGNLSPEPGKMITIFRDDSEPTPAPLDGCDSACFDNDECKDRCRQGVMLITPLRTAERTAQFAIAATDPDTETQPSSGLEYRVGIAGFQNLETAAWSPMTQNGATRFAVNLPDHDGTHQVQIVVRDQVGRTWTSGIVETPITLDRSLPSPIEVVGHIVGRNETIKQGDIVRLANGVDAPNYEGPYTLKFDVTVPDFEAGLTIVCVEGCANDDTTRCELADGMTQCELPAFDIDSRGFPATWSERFKFETRDRANNVSAHFNFAFTIDHQPPLLSSVRHQPKLGQPPGFVQLTDASASIDIELSTFDPSPTGGLRKVQIHRLINETRTETPIAEPAFAPTVSVNIDQAGWQTLLIRVEDSAGNVSEERPLLLFVDSATPIAAKFEDAPTAPQGVRLVTPSPDEPTTNRLTATIMINVSDLDTPNYQAHENSPLGDFGPTGLRYRVGVGSVDGAPWRPVPTACVMPPCLGTHFEHQVVLPDEEQLHQIAVQVIDASNRLWQLDEGQSVATVQVTVDRSIARPHDARAIIPTACAIGAPREGCERSTEWASGDIVSISPSGQLRGFGLRIRVTNTSEDIEACIGRCDDDDAPRCTIQPNSAPDAQGFLSCTIEAYRPTEQGDELRLPIYTRDKAGNQSAPYDFSLTIDNEAPTLLALNHEPNQGGKVGFIAIETNECKSPSPEYVNAEPVVTLDVTAIDGGGNDRLRNIHVASYPTCSEQSDCETGVCLAGACRTPCEQCVNDPLAVCVENACLGENLLVSSRYRPRIQVPARLSGERKFVVHVADSAGNWSTPAGVTIMRDEHCPTGSMTLLSNTRTNETKAQLRLTLEDLDQSSLEYLVTVDGQPQTWQEVPSRTFDTEFVLGAEPGEQIIGLMVRDQAGHTTTLVQTVSVFVDRTPIVPTSILGQYGAQSPFRNADVIAIQPDRDVLCESLDVDVPNDQTMSYTVSVNNSGQERITVCHDGCRRDDLGEESSNHCIIEPDANDCTITGLEPPNVLSDSIVRETENFTLVDEAGNVTEATFEFNVDHSAPRDFTSSIISRTVNEPTTDNPIVGVSALHILVESSDAASYSINDSTLDDSGALLSSQSMNANVDSDSFDAFGSQAAIIGLTPVDGVKLINVCFSDDVNNCACERISLRLDTQAPSFNVGLFTQDDEEIEVAQGGPARIDDPFIKVRVDLDANVDEPDCASFEDQSCGLYQRVSYDPSFAGAVWARAQPEVELNLPVVTSDRTIYVQLKDRVGNASDVTELDVKLELQLDIDGPNVPGITRTYIGPEKIRLAITPPDDPDLSYYVVERNIPSIDGAAWQRIRLTPAIADDGARTASANQTIPTACQVQASNCNGEATCLRKMPGLDQILVEDRNVLLGLVHQYRIRALDDLGNESAVSVPVYGGVPMEPTRLEITSLGDARTVSWAPAPGTFQVEQVLYTRRTLSGDLLTNEAIPPGQGSFNLKPLVNPDSNQFVRESVTLRTSNADRSIIWETVLSGLGVSALPIDSLEQTTNLKSVELSIEVDQSGTLHALESVTTDETFHRSPSALVYRKIAENGQSEAYYYSTVSLEDGTKLGAITPGNIELALDPDGQAYAIFFAVDARRFVLAQLGPPVNEELTGAVSLAHLDCPAPYYCGTNGTYFAWADLEFDAQGTAHFAIASYHDHQAPQRNAGLYYGTWTIDADIDMSPIDLRSEPIEANTGDDGGNQQDVGHSVQLVLRTNEDGSQSPVLVYGVGNGSTFSSDSLGVHHDIDTLRYAELSNVNQPALTDLDSGMTHNRAPCCPIGRRFLDASVDQDSVVHVVYNAGRNADVANSNQDTRYLTIDDGGPSAPLVLSNNRMQEAQPYRPKVSILNDGRAVLALLRIDANTGASPGDVYQYIETSPGAGAFTEYMVAEDRSTNPGGVDVAVDPDGRIRVGYDVPRGAFDMLVLDDLAAGYSDAPSLLGDPVGESGHFVRVARDLDGHLHVAYVNQASTGIVYARETEDGQWASQDITAAIPFNPAWDINDNGVQDDAKASMMLELSVCHDAPDCEDEDGGVQVMFAWGGPCSQTDNAYPQNNNFIWRNQGVGGVAEQIEDAFSGYAVSGCQRWERGAIAHDGIGQTHVVWLREGGDAPGLVYGRKDESGQWVETATQNLAQCSTGSNVFIRFDRARRTTPLIYCTSGSTLREYSLDDEDNAYIKNQWSVDNASQLLDVKRLDGDIADDAAGEAVPVFLWYSQGSLYVDRNGTASPTLVTTEFDYAEKNDFGALAHTPDGEVQIVYSRYRSTPSGGLTDFESRRLIDNRVTDAVAVGQFLDATPFNAIRPGFGLLTDAFWAELVYFDLDDDVNQLRRRRFRSKRRPLLVNHRRDATIFLGINGDRDADGRPDGSDVGYVQIDDAGSSAWSQDQAPENVESIDCASIWDPVLADTVVDFCQLCQPGALDTDEDGILDGTGENPIDNCAAIPNFDQADLDDDGIGDACDDDRDGDGRENWLDGCPDISNAEPADVDFDGIEDSCDPSVTPPTCTETNEGQTEPIAPNLATLPGAVSNEDDLTISVTVDLNGSNDFTPPCQNQVKGSDRSDRVFAFTPPIAGDWRFKATGLDGRDPIIALTDDCRQQNAQYLACSDDAGAGLSAEFTRRIDANETVFLVVDTYNRTATISLEVDCLGCIVKPDSDNDGVPDDEDNCVDIPNPAPQLNRDNDALGDACDTMFDESMCDTMIPECPRGQNCARRLDDEPELVNLTIPQLGKNNATISCGPRTRQVPIQIVRFLVTNPGEWTFRLQQAMPVATIARLDTCDVDAIELSCNTFSVRRPTTLTIDAEAGEEILLAIGDYVGFGGEVELLATPPAIQGGDGNDAGCEQTPSLVMESGRFRQLRSFPLQTDGFPNTWSDFNCPGGRNNPTIPWAPTKSLVFRFEPGDTGTWRISARSERGGDFGLAYANSCIEMTANVFTCNDEVDLPGTDSAIDLNLEANSSAYFVVGSRGNATSRVFITADCLDCDDSSECDSNQDCGGGNSLCKDGQCVEQNLNCPTTDAFCAALCGDRRYVLADDCDEPNCGCHNSRCDIDDQCIGDGLSCAENGRCIRADNPRLINCQDDEGCPPDYGCAAQDAQCHPADDFCGAEICATNEICTDAQCRPAPDCHGVPGGDARIDECGRCAGGQTGRPPCAEDCAGQFGGDAVEDNCGVCDANPNNDNASCDQDCAGVWNGQASLDKCNQCTGGTTGRAPCVQDCAGQWGGEAERDECGQCDSNPQNNCIQDCAGVFGGDAQEDDCGVCDTNPNNDNTTCEQDCEGAWGGNARLDQCLTCNANRADDCVVDCAGTFGGRASLDLCNICDDNSANDNLCARPCMLGTQGANRQDSDLSNPAFAALPNLLYIIQSNTSGGEPTLTGQGCGQGVDTTMSADITFRFVAPREGTWNFTLSQTVGKALMAYGNCPSQNAPLQNCALMQNGRAIHTEPLVRGQVIYLAVDGVDLRGAARDGAFRLEARLISSCAGANTLDAARDDCGVCDTDYTNDNTSCQQDCNGHWGGNAVEDQCGRCVGGETGLTACVRDCAGTWGGTAEEDMCGVCDDDADNDCVQDCNGTWGGSASVDACGVCDTDMTNDCIRCENDAGCPNGQRCANGVCEAAAPEVCGQAIDLISSPIIPGRRYGYQGNTLINSTAKFSARCAPTTRSADDFFVFKAPVAGTWIVRLSTDIPMTLSQLNGCPTDDRAETVDCRPVENGRSEIRLFNVDVGAEIYFVVDGIDNRFTPTNGEYALEIVRSGL